MGHFLWMILLVFAFRRRGAIARSFGPSVPLWFKCMASWKYDEAGNEVAQIDALNRTNTYDYNGQGRKIARTLPGGQSATFSLTLFG